jgi:DNA mismatch repair protein MutS
MSEQTSLDFGDIQLEDTTPMMRQYLEIKSKYAHCLLLYRMGDFYEAFLEDAETLSRELELVLTGRHAGEKLGRIPMAGIPYHALERYAAQLVEKGYALAICDQMEAADQAKGLVRREVTRVITPGTLLEEGLLAARQNNYLIALVQAGEHWGLAYTDISTGEFRVMQVEGLEPLIQEVYRLNPSEILLPTDTPDPLTLLRPGERSEHLPEYLPGQFCYTLRSQRGFLLDEAKERVLRTFKVRSLEGFGCTHLPLAVRAAGGLLEYLDDIGMAVPLQGIQTYTLSQYLLLDAQTRRNLELTQTVRDGSYNGSLLWALDRTKTSMGGRALRSWLMQPLLSVQAIEERLDSVEELVQDGFLRQQVQRTLEGVYDMERLSSRAGSGTANARDLLALAESLIKLPDIAAVVASTQSPYLTPLQEVSPELQTLAQRILRTLVDAPPLMLTEGGLIRSGVHEPLDQLNKQVEEDRQWIANLETTERQRTGVSTLKVSFNKTFGYYLSVSRTKSNQVPQDYIRKQTLVNEERYITPELKEKESRILNAREQRERLEYELFLELRKLVAHHVVAIRQIALYLSRLDALAGLAEVAVYRKYTRPKIFSDRRIEIEQGRHPVIEQRLPEGFFVPNDTQLSSTDFDPDLIVLTGPNMSGKSSYLRQVGLIQLMVQMGSFVPAQVAHLSMADRIFTRVGAVDDLAMGQSTFMVEMTETANILNHATPKSLVLLDEIGRGTATFDGLSIAWAVAEYLAAQIGARTIFATHYHELNELAHTLENVANYHVAVKEFEEEVVFLHRVEAGGADRSYGIEVGRLAGLPPVVIQRAKEVMHQVEQHSQIAVGLRRPGKK